VFSSEFPFKAVNEALQTGLEDVLCDSYGSPPLLAVGKDRQDSHRRPCPSVLLIFSQLTVDGLELIHQEGGIPPPYGTRRK